VENRRSVKKQGASRRSFLAGSATGLGSAWVTLNWSGILEAQEHARQMAASGQPGKFTFFSADQAVEIESVTAQILPTDETPGAREAGSVYFIDRALTTFDKERQSVYKQGLLSLQAKAGQLFSGASKFSVLTSAQQIQVLKAIENTPFFTAVRAHTITGFLVNPEYGGNQNKVGWNLIGFEGKFNYQPPFGYYDRESKSAALPTGKV
jgi:gluconate 2-dehydrogenase gamma chain